MTEKIHQVDYRLCINSEEYLQLCWESSVLIKMNFEFIKKEIADVDTKSLAELNNLHIKAVSDITRDDLSEQQFDDRILIARLAKIKLDIKLIKERTKWKANSQVN